MTLEQVSYTDKFIHDMIIESFYETEFVGVSGYVAFDKEGDLTGVIELSQQQGICVMQYFIVLYIYQYTLVHVHDYIKYKYIF